MAPPGTKIVATNRRARRDYEIGDVIECGLVLKGSEVKSLRESKVQLADAYARIENGEMWLLGLHIAPYSHGQGVMGHEPDRPRKLLLHRAEIQRIGSKVNQDRLTLVPLSLYFKNGRAKIEIALGKGRRTVDRREEIARRDADREAARAMARSRRRLQP